MIDAAAPSAPEKSAVPEPLLRSLPEPYYQDEAVIIYHGDSRKIIPLLPEFDMLLTDPPYSSGGMFRGDRQKDPSEKYVHNGVNLHESFNGDTMDQRSFYRWGCEWLADCRDRMKPNAYAVIFTDWRQLPATSDYFQAAGLIWRGIIAWDKGEGARAPHKGYFRHQAEYAVWGTNGECPQILYDGPFPGVIRETVKQADKFHMTGKPTNLFSTISRACVPGGLLVDPFMGSGTTLRAAKNLGRRAIGIDLSANNCEIAKQRMVQESFAF